MYSNYDSTVNRYDQFSCKMKNDRNEPRVVHLVAERHCSHPTDWPLFGGTCIPVKQ